METLIIVPSTRSRCTAGTHAEVLGHILAQIEGIPRVGLVFALQDVDAGRLVPHLDRVAARLGRKAERVLFCPILGLGKTAALNEVLAVIPPEAAPDLVGWIDDDVLLGEGTLVRMIAAMRETPHLLVAGARKAPVAYEGHAARWFLSVKRTARPAGTLAWPHGCAMLVRAELVKNGLPLCYGGEDGYLVLSAFVRSGDAATRGVALVDGTSCAHVVGGPGRQIPSRVIRTIFENSVLLANFPDRASLEFARRAIFHGLYAHDASFPARLLGAAHYAFYLVTGLVLLGRGVLGRPKHAIAWSGYRDHARPAPAAGHGRDPYETG